MDNQAAPAAAAQELQLLAEGSELQNYFFEANYAFIQLI